MTVLPTNTSIMDIFETGIRRLGDDALKSFKTFDISYIFLAGGGILLALLLIDFVGYLVSAYEGTSNQFVPFSRNIVVSAADAWDNRESNYIGDFYDPYARARSLDSLTSVLDSISTSIKKWDSDSNATEETLQRLPKDREFVFSQ